MGGERGGHRSGGVRNAHRGAAGYGDPLLTPGGAAGRPIRPEAVRHCHVPHVHLLSARRGGVALVPSARGGVRGGWAA